ncbi:restriction endonuclease subunit S [Trichothermofontia sp.]
MNEWKEVKVDQLCEAIIDCVNKTAPIVDEVTPYRMIRTTNIKDGRIDLSSTNYVTEDVFRKWTKRSVLRENDIILTREAPLGEVGQIIDGENLFLGQRLMMYRPDPNVVDPNFLFYSFRSKDVQHQIRGFGMGSTVEHMRVGDCSEIIVKVPSLQEQREIGKTLSALDRKISNLRQQNQTLEKIAQTLFKHWFIDFEFPNADGQPYKSSGGAMVQSELGEIPAGWRVVNLNSIISTTNGYSYKSTDLGESDTALVNLKNFDRHGGFRLDGFKEITTTNYQDRHLAEPNDLLVAHTDLTQNAEVLGNPVLLQPLPKYSRYVLSMDVVKIISKDKRINNFYLYYLLSTHFFKQHCIGYANGTTVLHLSKKAIPEYEFSMPADYSVIKAFQDTAFVLRRRIDNNLKQIQTLTKIRDLLLPKLMSGQLRITP